MYILDEQLVLDSVKILEGIYFELNTFDTQNTNDFNRKLLKYHQEFINDLIKKLTQKKAKNYFFNQHAKIEKYQDKQFLLTLIYLQMYFDQDNPYAHTDDLYSVYKTLLTVFNHLLTIMKKYFYRIWSRFYSKIPEELLRIKPVLIFNKNEHEHFCLSRNLSGDWKVFISTLRLNKKDTLFENGKPKLPKEELNIDFLLKGRNINFSQVFNAIAQLCYLFLKDNFDKKETNTSALTEEACQFLLQKFFLFLAKILYDSPEKKEYFKTIKEKLGIIKKDDEKNVKHQLSCVGCHTALTELPYDDNLYLKCYFHKYCHFILCKKCYVKNFEKVAGICASQYGCSLIICTKCNNERRPKLDHKCSKASGFSVKIMYKTTPSDIKKCPSCQVGAVEVQSCEEHERQLFLCCYNKMRANDPLITTDSINWCVDCNPINKKTHKTFCESCELDNVEIISYCYQHKKSLFKCCYEKNYSLLNSGTYPNVWCDECKNFKPKKPIKNLRFGSVEIKEFYRQSNLDGSSTNPLWQEWPEPETIPTIGKK